MLTPRWGSVFVLVVTWQHTSNMLMWLKLVTDATSLAQRQEQWGGGGVKWVITLVNTFYCPLVLLIDTRSWLEDSRLVSFKSIYWRRKLSSFFVLFLLWMKSSWLFSDFFFLFSRLQGGRRRPTEDWPRRHRRSRGRGHVCHPVRAHRARAVLCPTQR